jgi:3-oxoacyl-[acyl-carrier protein] reductase
MDLGLRGRYALITGGSHGIGRSIALGLAEEGANVAICARGKDRVQTVVDELRTKGVKALGIVADAVKPADIDRVMGEIEREWGALQILVNNVGGGGRWGKESPEETDDAVWIEVHEKNALAAARFTVRALPYMRRAGWGRVVTVASRHGKEGGGRPWFTMTKSAEIALMKAFSLRTDYPRAGITFNTVAPGDIMIAGTGWEREARENPSAVAALMREAPLGRFGTPEEVAYAVVFLCSVQASLVNGACLPLDGGESRSY